MERWHSEEPALFLAGNEESLLVVAREENFLVP